MSTLVIATDEAGYGPMIGPLVIVATAWKLPAAVSLETAAQRLAQPLTIDGLGPLWVDDSKKIFKPPRPGAAVVKPAIDWLSEAAAHWLRLPDPATNLDSWLRQVAADDAADLLATPWYHSSNRLAWSAASRPARGRQAAGSNPHDQQGQQQIPGPAEAADQVYQPLIDHWSAGGLQLVGQAARVIDAETLNLWLDTAGNKSDLLGATTSRLAIELLQSMIDRHQQDGPIERLSIHSDRLGGRAYYGAMLQHQLPDRMLMVLAETSQRSSYRLIADDQGLPPLEWHFSVSGDQFPPVAMSSVIAKSTRERLMGRLNGYFQAAMLRQRRPLPPLRATAGYAADAQRFLRDTATLRRRLKIDDARLIRRK